MAVLRPSSLSFALILALASLVFQLSSAQSQTCSSETFTNNKVYSNCTDLPTLNAKLHWTYSSENSSLAIAYTAPPATPNGWVAWAINPTGTGMAGSQALIAFRNSNGSLTVKTYNISSYVSIVEGKIAFEVPESSAEFSGGVMRIFATVVLPEEVNYVWQVGGSVTNGIPDKHASLPENLRGMGKLQLDGNADQSNGTVAGSPTGTPAGTTTPGTPSANSASVNAGVYGFLTIIGCLLGYF